MQHLEDGYLHAIADGEVPSEELVAVREHLDACESCRARLDEARNDAESARELVELIEVPLGADTADRADRADGAVAAVRTSRGPRWVRPVAWAASLVLAAGIGYYGRRDAPFAAPPAVQSAVPAAEPLSIGRIDTVFLDVPAQTRPGESREADRAKAPPARQEVAGARAEEEQSARRRAGADTTALLRLDEVTVTANAATPSKKLESKDANAKLSEGIQERAASDARDQLSRQVARRPDPQPAAPAVAAESRLMAKSSAGDAPVIISFPRAVELLGGRIKLVEGMVPVRLEAMGRTVRVIYLIDEGDLVLAQVAAPDSLNWNLSGPLSADSLESLRLRVK